MAKRVPLLSSPISSVSESFGEGVVVDLELGNLLKNRQNHYVSGGMRTAPRRAGQIQGLKSIFFRPIDPERHPATHTTRLVLVCASVGVEGIGGGEGYLFILIRSDSDELRLRKDISPEGAVRKLHYVISSHDVKPGLVLVH